MSAGTSEKIIEVASPNDGLRPVMKEDLDDGRRLKALIHEFGLELFKKKNQDGNLGLDPFVTLARALRMDFEKRFAAAGTVATGYAKWHPEQGFDPHHYEGPTVFADLDDALVADVNDANEEEGTNNRNGWRATPVKVTVFR